MEQKQKSVFSIPIAFLGGFVQLPFVYIVTLLTYLSKVVHILHYLLLGDYRLKLKHVSKLRFVSRFILELVIQLWFIHIFTFILPFFLAFKALSDYLYPPSALPPYYKRLMANEVHTNKFIAYWKLIKKWKNSNGWNSNVLRQCGAATLCNDQNSYSNKEEDVGDLEQLREEWISFIDNLQIIHGDSFFNKLILQNGSIACAIGPRSIYVAPSTKLDIVILRHETCHCLQFSETKGGYAEFFAAYFADYLSHFLLNGFDAHRAYCNIVAEKQAYYLEKLRSEKNTVPYNSVASSQQQTYSLQVTEFNLKNIPPSSKKASTFSSPPVSPPDISSHIRVKRRNIVSSRRTLHQVDPPSIHSN